MLDKLDIALLCDSVWTDGAGDRRTKDRSRHGIHPTLGDGTTAATFPTFDALNARFEFDGGDYINIRNADDVDGVLAGMASIQNETYIVYFDPLVAGTGVYSHEIFSTEDGANPRFFARKTGGVFTFQFYDGVGNLEFLNTGAIETSYDGQRFAIVYVREPTHPTQKQRAYINDILVATANSTPRDASNAKAKRLGATLVPGNYLPAGTGIKFFGYGRFVATQTWLRQLSRNLRGLL